MNEHVDDPHEFEAVQVTTVVPEAKVDPEAGAQLTVGVGVPVAEGVEYVTTGFDVVMSAGHAPITGLSLIVTVNEQLDAPQEFVAVHCTVVAPVAKLEPDAGIQITLAAGDAVAVGAV